MKRCVLLTVEFILSSGGRNASVSIGKCNPQRFLAYFTQITCSSIKCLNFLLLFGTWAVFKSLVDTHKRTFHSLPLRCILNLQIVLWFFFHTSAVIGMQFAFWSLSQLHPLLIKSQCQKKKKREHEWNSCLLLHDRLLSQPGTWCVHLKILPPCLFYFFSVLKQKLFTNSVLNSVRQNISLSLLYDMKGNVF